MGKETESFAISDWEETNNLVSVVETDTPGVFWVVVVNADWSNI